MSSICRNHEANTCEFHNDNIAKILLCEWLVEKKLVQLLPLRCQLQCVTNEAVKIIQRIGSSTNSGNYLITGNCRCCYINIATSSLSGDCRFATFLICYFRVLLCPFLFSRSDFYFSPYSSFHQGLEDTPPLLKSLNQQSLFSYRLAPLLTINLNFAQHTESAPPLPACMLHPSCRNINQ